MTDLSDLTVLVTGATSGVGNATVRRFLAAGSRVVGTGRRRERLDALVGELGERFFPLCFDVRDRDAAFAALDDLPGHFAAVDVLVNNAGLALGLEPSWRVDLADWDAMVDTNIRGVLSVTRRLLPGMVERGRGHVVNVSSVAGTYPYPGGNVYGATKAFVTQLSLNLRADLHGTGVRVTSVEPGLLRTEFALVRFKGDVPREEAFYAGADPLTPDDVAEAIAWAVAQPARVNVNRIELMPTSQSFAPHPVHRR